MKDCLKKAMLIMISVFLFMLSGCADQGQELRPSTVGHKDSSQYQSGLSVVYIFQKYRSVDQIPTGQAAHRMGRPGKPVTMLNHQSDKEGEVFDSGRSQGVAMVMAGYLHLQKTGTYRWQALANDGIRMFIDNKMIFEDPKVHSDRLTPTGTFEVYKGGWYPVSIVYFQRKGTAALKLYWQPPGDELFSLVPAEVYGH